MYIAELHGKLSQRIERMEDILTSNVFSFFKYSTPKIFLKGYLKKLGFDVSDQEATEAEFIFWPRFEENTVGKGSNLRLALVRLVNVPGNTK